MNHKTIGAENPPDPSPVTASVFRQRSLVPNWLLFSIFAGGFVLLSVIGTVYAAAPIPARPRSAPGTAIAFHTAVPCYPPCWHGIVPGPSTDQQAEAAVENMPGYRRTSGLIEWGDGNSIQIVNGRVAKILLTYPPFSYTLGDVFDKFGPPEKFRYPIFGAEDARVAFDFLYPSRGMEFGTGFKYRDGVPERTMPVSYSEYYPPMSLADYISKYNVVMEVSDWMGWKP